MQQHEKCERLGGVDARNQSVKDVEFLNEHTVNLLTYACHSGSWHLFERSVWGRVLHTCIVNRHVDEIKQHANTDDKKCEEQAECQKTLGKENIESEC